MSSLKDLAKKQDIFCSGHRACSGCAPAITMRQVTLAVDKYLNLYLLTDQHHLTTLTFSHNLWGAED